VFEGFANVWTPIELASRVRSRPLPLTVASQRVVVFRGADGKLAALLDRCPHRGVALSLGKLTPEGALECPFHGWQFNGQGACVRVPLNPDARCARLGATALPVREAGGLIWLYTAPVATPPAEPIIPEALVARTFRRYYLTKVWRAHWTRAIENMLDTPHVPFVHRRTIGFSMRRRLRPDSRITMTWTPTKHGARIEAALDDRPPESTLEFVRPNGMTLHIPVRQRRLRIHVFCVPISPQETRMIVVSARDFGRYNPFTWLFDEMNRLILLEDQAIVESSDPPEVPRAVQERSVESDRPTLKFRKYYFDILRESSARFTITDESAITG
jgi:phenylpropionate dioxygenase-like ring-hydroxylating dioxygenase large terminal subunit